MKVRFILTGVQQTGPDTFSTYYITVDADVPELLDEPLLSKELVILGVELRPKLPAGETT